MRLVLYVALAMLLACPAWAQGTGGGGGVVTLKGAGTLSVSSPVAINTMTITWTANAPAAVPGVWTNLTVINNGTGDIAVCAQGGACTCLETTITPASTNGITIKAGGASNSFSWPSVAATTPTIVSCDSSAESVDFQF
jgi:hypothetical protein